MQIILSPDSFKESLSAVQVCAALKRGILNAMPDAEVIELPLADGGEGTVQTLVASTNGTIKTATVTGPLGQPVTAAYGLLGDGKTAVIEMAAASGLPLIPRQQRNPLHTTTFGTGQLIRQALDNGADTIFIGIGGSATNDGGAGMAQALGARFYHKGSLITEYLTGALLAKIDAIDLSGLDPRLSNSKIIVACDVDNPLLGERGAAAVYAPQKGADAETVQLLEQNMKKFYDEVERMTSPVRHLAGAGAAGGLGAGLVAFAAAELVSGIDAVLDICRFDEKIAAADFIITGEGKIDEQSAMGKTISGVLRRAKKQDVPVIAIGGSISPGAKTLHNQGLVAMFSICNQPMSLRDAMAHADTLLAEIAEQIMRLVAATPLSR